MDFMKLLALTCTPCIWITIIILPLTFNMILFPLGDLEAENTLAESMLDLSKSKLVQFYRPGKSQSKFNSKDLDQFKVSSIL